LLIYIFFRSFHSPRQQIKTLCLLAAVPDTACGSRMAPTAPKYGAESLFGSKSRLNAPGTVSLMTCGSRIAPIAPKYGAESLFGSKSRLNAPGTVSLMTCGSRMAPTTPKCGAESLSRQKDIRTKRIFFCGKAETGTRYFVNDEAEAQLIPLRNFAHKQREADPL